MYTLAEADKDRLQALIDAAQAAYDSALLLRNTQQRSIVKTDMAMAALHEAVQNARRVTFKKVVERKTRAATHR
jgi:hypothetical protein